MASVATNVMVFILYVCIRWQKSKKNANADVKALLQDNPILRPCSHLTAMFAFLFDFSQAPETRTAAQTFGVNRPLEGAK